jgi:hypothetical protein
VARRVLDLPAKEPARDFHAEDAMTLSRIGNRALGILLPALLATAALAPVAQAGHGHGRVRYKGAGPYDGGPRMARVVRHPPFYFEHHSGAGPAIAGFLGGLVLGTVLANAQPAPPPGTTYFDPYCDQRFVSLDLYGEHFCHHHHPRVIRVIEVRSGRCVDTYGWRDGRWTSRDDREGRDEDRDEGGNEDWSER